VTSFRLWGADFLVGVSTLGNVQFPLFEINVSPPEAAQLARSQSGEDCGQEERAPPALGGLNDGFDLVGGGDIDADLELALLTPIRAAFLAAFPARGKIAHHVASYLVAL